MEGSGISAGDGECTMDEHGWVDAVPLRSLWLRCLN